MNWDYILLQASCLTGILLGIGFILFCTLSGIAQRLDKKRREKQEQQYRASWSAWGDMTDLRRAS